ncbi:hypothetical protein FNY88_02975 [Corynebacterium guaraldiae]|uniref:Trypsin n=2 Tax=Corynebacterium guaraldiae TaxID=3051103 RepID=A0ABY3CVJ3_9CORY|nr:hypothetical protein FNY88_02975 [Corynebacterium guaraldiae]TRX51217.1 hypothetical protein FNY91_10405 [Corynebacterium guaraldiae]
MMKWSPQLRFSRVLPGFAFMAGACSLAFALAAPATAAEGVPVRQGQKIAASDGALCTVGYVEANRAWTSAHCGLNGEQVYNEAGQHLGTLRWFTPSGAAGHDLAYIQFAGGTYSAGNPLTGDGMAPVPGEGSTVCFDGQAASRQCGTAVKGPGVFPGMNYAADVSLAPGDSGGAVSVPGRPGVVGIYQGITQANRGGRTVTFSNYARMPHADELARLPHQGWVPRRPNREPGNPVRVAQEKGEALSSTSSAGPEGLRGLAMYFGLGI